MRVVLITFRSATDDENPRAYVVMTPGASITAEDVVDYVKERVSKVKWLTGGVAFVDAIPKNPVWFSVQTKVPLWLTMSSRARYSDDSCGSVRPGRPVGSCDRRCKQDKCCSYLLRAFKDEVHSTSQVPRTW